MWFLNYGFQNVNFRRKSLTANSFRVLVRFGMDPSDKIVSSMTRFYGNPSDKYEGRKVMKISLKLEKCGFSF